MGKPKSTNADNNKASPINWRQKLSKININTLYENRTCDIYLFIESTEIYYEVVTKFAAGSKFRPEAAHKIIRNIDILNDIRYPDLLEFPKEIITTIYNMARAEAATYVDRYAHIPLELLSKLIKLMIIHILTLDINLMDPAIVPKKRESEKYKKRSSSILKTENRKSSALERTDGIKIHRHLYILLGGFYELELIKYLFNIGVTLSAIIEITGVEDDYVPEEELRISERESIVDIVKKVSTDYNDGRRPTIDIADRKCMIDLAARRSTIDIAERCSTIDIAKSSSSINIVRRGFTPDLRGRRFSMDSTGEISTVEKLKSSSSVDIAVQVPFTFSSFTSDLVPLFISTQPEMEIEGLNNFWDKLHDMLDGTQRSKYLLNAAHMKIPRSFEINLEVCDDYTQQSIKTFEEIVFEIQKIVIMQKEHQRYIESLNIYNVTYKPKMKSIDTFKTYKLLSAAIPPECFSIEVIINCMVEEVLVRSLKEKKRAVVIRSRKSALTRISPFRKEADKTRIENLVLELPRRHGKNKLKTKRLLKLRKWLKRSVRMISPYDIPAIVSYEYQNQSSKTRLKIKVKDFEMHKSNEIFYKAHCYPQISVALIYEQLNILNCCAPACLFHQYKPLSPTNKLIIKHRVQTWAKAIHRSEDQMHYFISTLAFENLSCKLLQITLPRDKTALQLSFPDKSYLNEEKTVVTQIKYIRAPPRIPIYKTVHPPFLMPILRHSINDNVYESRNVGGYPWFEKLSKTEILQSTLKAQKNYICMDHRYCPLNDSILLRYHNHTDLFGMNSKIWKQHIYTPIGFKDFCKYVFHQNNYKKCFGATAYNISNDRVQLHGTTNIFHSIDGCKVIAEKTDFIGRSTNLTISICVDSNYLVLQCNKTIREKPFHFHIKLEDGTIIALKKHSPYNKSGCKVAECFNQKPDLPKRKPCRYIVTETTTPRFRNFDKPITNFNALTTKEVLSEKYSVENGVLKIPESKRLMLRSFYHRLPTNIPSDIEYSEDDYCRKRIRVPKAPSCRRALFRFKKTVVSMKEIIEKINSARKNQIPLFKVCSSKLHKFSYLVPCKSTVTIQIGKQVFSMLCHHPRRKMKREIKVIKVKPFRHDLDFDSSHWYDMSLSLPTGLILYTIPSLDEGPFNIKQEYSDRGPSCKSISEECNRTFMRDGSIVIKKLDGTIDILGNGGINMHCDLPYQATSFRAKNKIKRTLQKCTLNVRQYKLTQRDKLIDYIVRTKARHVVGTNANRHFAKSRIQRHFARVQEYQNSNKSKTMYYVRENARQFAYMQCNGTKITITDKTCKGRISYYRIKTSHKEILYTKLDGVKCILKTDATLITQFPDGTRITTTCCMMPIVVFDGFYRRRPKRNIWILVHTMYKFEHPNYVTIDFDNMDYRTEVTLENNVKIKITERGEYTINVKENYMKVQVNRDAIKYYSTSCTRCKQNFNALLDISPLFYERDYNKKDYEVLRAYDTYDKMFSVFADGKCYKNCNFHKTRGNKFKCVMHDQVEHQQLFVLNRNLSGYKLWDTKAVRKLLTSSKNNPCVTITQGEKKPSKNLGYKYLNFKIPIEAAHFRLFKTTLKHLHFLQTNEETKRVLKHYQQVTKLNFICKPPEISFFSNSINDACGKANTCPFTEDSMMQYIKNLSTEFRKARYSEMPEDISPEFIKSNLEAAQLLCQQWYAWHKFYDKSPCTCEIHDTDKYPLSLGLGSDITIAFQEPLNDNFDAESIESNELDGSDHKDSAELDSIFTNRSPEPFVGSAKSNQPQTGYQGSSGRYNEEEMRYRFMQSHLEVANFKWDLLENASNTDSFVDEELIRFSEYRPPVPIGKSISDTYINVFPHKYEERSSIGSVDTNALEADAMSYFQYDKFKKMQSEIEPQPTTAELFETGLETEMQLVAEERLIAKQKIIELSKRRPRSNYQDIRTRFKLKSPTPSTHQSCIEPSDHNYPSNNNSPKNSAISAFFQETLKQFLNDGKKELVTVQKSSSSTLTSSKMKNRSTNSRDSKYLASCLCDPNSKQKSTNTSTTSFPKAPRPTRNGSTSEKKESLSITVQKSSSSTLTISKMENSSTNSRDSKYLVFCLCDLNSKQKSTNTSTTSFPKAPRPTNGSRSEKEETLPKAPRPRRDGSRNGKGESLPKAPRPIRNKKKRT